MNYCFKHILDSDSVLGRDQRSILCLNTYYILYLIYYLLRLRTGQIYLIYYREYLQVMIQCQIYIG